MNEDNAILTINGGSSSLKVAVYALEDLARKRFSARVERVGREGGRLVVKEGDRSEDVAVSVPDQAAAAGLVMERLESTTELPTIAGIGHRIVHGGTRFVETTKVSATMLDELRKLSPLDPDHLPGQLALIETLERAFPDVTQYACFDTAFHRNMLPAARVVPIPRRYQARGVRRYGFHGLSYTYLLQELARIAGPEEARGRIVLAHLGAGSSLAAVREGRPLDTSMGFTPASGLVMGTRSGDIDPGLVGYLALAEGLAPDRLCRMLNEESGLLGLSETTADVRDLLARRETDPRAAEAIDVYGYHARRWLGGFAATLGGLDTLVFTGGIGENSPEIRGAICQGLEFLGIHLDSGRNAASAPVISTDASPVKVRVIRTDEEAVIARDVARLLR
jgi:acetate kinase